MIEIAEFLPPTPTPLWKLAKQAGVDWAVGGLPFDDPKNGQDQPWDLARQVGSYLRDTHELADFFVEEYLRLKPVEAGFAERQRLYMLYDSAIIWAFWQRYAGGLPEDKTLTLERWASPFVEYGRRYD